MIDKTRRGERVILISSDDPYTKLKPGDRGTILGLDDALTLHVNWDNGSTLGLVVPGDKWKIIEQPYNLLLTPVQRGHVEWALEAMREWVEHPGEDPEDGPGYTSIDLPELRGGTLYYNTGEALNDLLYRIGEQLVDMTDCNDEFTEATKATRIAGMIRLCDKLRQRAGMGVL